MSSSWISCPLSELPIASGKNISPFDFPDEEFELYSVPSHETGRPELVKGGEIGSNKQIVTPGTVLLCKINPRINRTWVVGEAGTRRQIASTEWIAFERSNEVDQRYLMYFMQQSDFRDFLAANASGVGGSLMRVKPATLKGLTFRAPGVRTQRRIVEKLEELLSDLDVGVAELKTAQRKLAQYRQSLLKAAAEGALTTDWRAARAASGEPLETGAELLQRILSERRRRWEQNQRDRYAQQGKAPPTGWQAKYPEPVAPAPPKWAALPDSWVWVSLDQLLVQLRSGTAETSRRDATDFPVLKSSAVRQGAIDFTALNYLTDQQSREENHLALQDLLLTRLSGSVEYVGCAAVVSKLPDGGIQYPDRIFCGKVVPGFEALGDYLAHYLRSPSARARIEAAAKSTAGHKRISLSDLQPFPIPLPPLAELRTVVDRLNTFLGHSDEAETSTESGLHQAAAQRKNLLRAAFEGQLVAQDPNDEPASELLVRIRAARAAKPAKSRRLSATARKAK